MLSFNQVFLTGLYSLKLCRQYFCGAMKKFDFQPIQFMLSTVNPFKLMVEALGK